MKKILDKIKFFTKNKSKSNIKPKINNSWYHYKSDADTVLIFVHGFLSNANSCWTSKCGAYWPDIVFNDHRFNHPSIYLGGYHTSIDSGGYKLRDCADELLSALDREDSDNRLSPLEYSNILFVCHSLGGIVTRYMLEAYTSKFKDKTIGLALMASPSIGSEYATNFSGIIEFYKNSLAGQLKHMNDALSDLDDRFKILLGEGRIPNLVGSEAVEHHFPYRLKILPGLRPIVTKDSASRYFAMSQTLATTDHSSIVKPMSISGPGHIFLYDFYTKHFKPIIISNNPKKNIRPPITPEPSLTSRVLFDIYGPGCKDFYATRSIDKELDATMPYYSIWVSGPSGCGKTSAIRHMLDKHNYKPIEICLSSCQGDLTNNRLITEISTTVQQRLGGELNSFSPTLSSLCQLLSEHAKESPLVLYLDEVPIQESNKEAIQDFSILIATLLESVKHLTRRSDIRFVISSIVSPSASVGNQGKFAEHFSLIKMFRWTEVEILKLADIIISNIDTIKFSSDEKITLIRIANGSPRFLKTYFKNRLIFPEMPSNETLDITLNQGAI